MSQPPYGQPPNQPPMGQPPYGQPPMGQAPYGQPMYGQPPMGQAPYGQPMYGQPPQPIKKGRSPILFIILGIVGVLLLACIGGFAFLFTVGNSAKSDSEKVFTQFMQEAKAGDASAASALCTSDIPKSDLTSYFASLSFLKDYQSFKSDSDLKYSNDNGKELVQLTGTADYGASGSHPFKAQLTKVGNNWRIQFISLTSSS